MHIIKVIPGEAEQLLFLVLLYMFRGLVVVTIQLFRILMMNTEFIHLEEKREEIWLSPMAKAPTTIEKSNKQHDNIKTPPKTLITQRLRTDLGRSVGVTAVTPLVWLNRFSSAQPSHSPNQNQTRDADSSQLLNLKSDSGTLICTSVHWMRVVSSHTDII